MEHKEHKEVHEHPIHQESFQAEIKEDLGFITSAIHATDEESKDLQSYPPEIVKLAEELSFFHVDPPRNAPDGVNYGNYNIFKGLISGSYMIVTHPWVLASHEVEKVYKDAEEENEEIENPDERKEPGFGELASAAFQGFGFGIVRGMIGGTSLMITGSCFGAQQWSEGVINAPPLPGQGRNLYENWRHVVYSRTLDIVTLREPDEFKKELTALIEEGVLPEKKHNMYGHEVPHSYEFFWTDEPKNVVDGFGGLQYNAGKGILAGTALLLSAPWVDSWDQAIAVDEKGVSGGFEGYVKGFGEGIARGTVGGATLAAAGFGYGAMQMGRGFVSLDNIGVVVMGGENLARDFKRIDHDPLPRIIQQKGWGLEAYLLKEQGVDDATESESGVDGQ